MTAGRAGGDLLPDQNPDFRHDFDLEWKIGCFICYLEDLRASVDLVTYICMYIYMLIWFHYTIYMYIKNYRKYSCCWYLCSVNLSQLYHLTDLQRHVRTYMYVHEVM